ADLRGRRLSTMDTRAERRVVDLSKALRLLEKSPVEALLGPRGGLLEEVERFLIEEALGADAVGAFLHDVVDPPDHRVRGRLALGGPVEGLDLLYQVRLGAREHRSLPGKVLRLPVQEVAEEHGRLVVEIVARGDDTEPEVQGGPVEQVPLAQPAGRAGRAPRGAGEFFDVHPELTGDVRDEQFRALAGGIRLGL